MAGKNLVAKTHGAQNEPRVDVCTPPIVLDAVRDVYRGQIEFDPASHPNSVVNAKLEVMLEMYRRDMVMHPHRNVMFGDGLRVRWGKRKTFVNPPYSRKDNPAWSTKMLMSHTYGGTEIHGLVPSSPCTEWFKSFHSGVVAFWDGRITFLGKDAPADFENAVVYFGPSRRRFVEVFHSLGCWIPQRAGILMGRTIHIPLRRLK